MPAVIRRLRFGDGSIRLGPHCFIWHDPYTRSLSFEIERVNVAVIGGLTWSPSDEEYRWVEAAFINEGLRMAQYRVVRGRDGSPVLDANGRPVTRRRLLPMPSLRKRTQPALSQGCNPESRMPYEAKTNIRDPEDSMKSGSVDEAVVAADAAHASEMYTSGKEKLLGLHRVVLHDGSVIDSFHHTAA